MKKFTLSTLAVDIAKDADALGKGGAGLVRKVCAYALAYAKVNTSSHGKGIDEAHNAVEKVMTALSSGYIDKAMSQAKAVMGYGTYLDKPLKAVVLGATEESALITEALDIMKAVDLNAAIEARIKANGGKKGGRPKAEKTTPAPDQVAPNLSAGASVASKEETPLMIETRVMGDIAALIEAGDMGAVMRITANLNAYIYGQNQQKRLAA